MAELQRLDDRVGPVIVSGAEGDAVVAAIRRLNDRVSIVDRGAYRRVLVPHRCVLTREAVEEHLGRAFRMPQDLERIMPSFKGKFTVSQDRAEWRFGGSA